MDLSNKTIVVTGGGNGMGRELVLNLLKRGNNVIAMDINESALQETFRLAENRKKALATMVVDVTSKDSIDELVNKSIAIFGQVDGIIDNAGVIQPFVKLNDTDFTIIKRVFDINFFGTLYMMKAFLPHLLTRPEACIVNISSMGGFLPVPGQSVYGASKAAVKILTESLASELTATNVRVTTVFPGAIFTNIKANSGLGKEKSAGKDPSKYAVAPKGVLEPAVAAEIIIKGVEQNKVRVFVGRDSKIMNAMYRLNPTFASKLISKKIKENHHI